MESSVAGLRVDQPAHYRIKLLGRLGAHWAESLDDFAITTAPSDGSPAVTTLEGRVTDQPALFGLLSRIRDLGLPLLLVECLAGASPDNSSD